MRPSEERPAACPPDGAPGRRAPGLTPRPVPRGEVRRPPLGASRPPKRLVVAPPDGAAGRGASSPRGRCAARRSPLSSLTGRAEASAAPVGSACRQSAEGSAFGGVCSEALGPALGPGRGARAPSAGARRAPWCPPPRPRRCGRRVRGGAVRRGRAPPDPPVARAVGASAPDGPESPAASSTSSRASGAAAGAASRGPCPRAAFARCRRRLGPRAVCHGAPESGPAATAGARQWPESC